MGMLHMQLLLQLPSQSLHISLFHTYHVCGVLMSFLRLPMMLAISIMTASNARYWGNEQVQGSLAPVHMQLP